jgi:hypothetical protein
MHYKLGQSMQIGRVAPIIAAGAVLGLLVLFFFYLMIGVSHIDNDQSNVNGHAVSACIDKYRPPEKAQSASFEQEFLPLQTFCYSTLLSQLKIDEDRVIRDNYLFQRNENVVLLYMVVIITLSGVVLAGLQLLASYKLAEIGRAELSGGGEISYSARGVSFKSSVVGLMILAMSFAFFLVFIIYVYSFQYASSNSNDQNAAPQRMFNLLPAPANLAPHAAQTPNVAKSLQTSKSTVEPQSAAPITDIEPLQPPARKAR